MAHLLWPTLSSCISRKRRRNRPASPPPLPPRDILTMVGFPLAPPRILEFCLVPSTPPHDASVAVWTMQEPNLDGDAAIESLLNVKKRAVQLAADVAGTRKASVDIVELCYKEAAWETLNDQIVDLSGRFSLREFPPLCLFRVRSCQFDPVVFE